MWHAGLLYQQCAIGRKYIDKYLEYRSAVEIVKKSPLIRTTRERNQVLPMLMTNCIYLKQNKNQNKKKQIYSIITVHNLVG